MTEEKINVDVYNWGPCVVRVKIKDDLVKTLLKEGKNNRLDFRDKLAGIIENETGYSTESKQKVLPQLSQYLGVYDQVYQNYVKQPYETKPEYVLSSLWINHQRPNEFNPPHDHDGKISFVIYLQVPEEIKKENQAFVGKSCGPGGIQFVYGEGPRDCVTTLSYFPEVGDMFMFPSWLKHWVAPFKSDCLRISVSGNFHDQVPLNNVVNFAPQYIKDKKKK
jgi:hypothetical protein|tara:strand:- start:637 stop:1299 length:663 start_codon:yes stop_codon:yes gene_type:complete